MKHRAPLALFLAAALFLGGCQAGQQPSPPPSPPPSPSPEERTLFAAGDIAYCDSQGDEATARLIESRAPKKGAWAVLALGDLAYPDGTREEFENCYDPSWGRFKEYTYPVPGNHEYHTKDAAGYFGYFGDQARPPGGYYRFTYADWSLYALNSNLSLKSGSRQYRWLEKEIQGDDHRCKLAFLHRPRYSSGVHGDATSLEDLWQLLSNAGFALVLSGHDHHYERIEAGGPVQFVVGSGGAPLRKIKRRRPGSEAYVDDAHGVLELILSREGYRFRFLDVDDRQRDAGKGDCAP